MSVWADIKFAPKDGTLVDLWVVSAQNSGSRIPDCVWENLVTTQNYGWVHRSGTTEADFVLLYAGLAPTHYMPIPEPPVTR